MVVSSRARSRLRQVSPKLVSFSSKVRARRQVPGPAPLGSPAESLQGGFGPWDLKGPEGERGHLPKSRARVARQGAPTDGVRGGGRARPYEPLELDPGAVQARGARGTWVGVCVQVGGSLRPGSAETRGSFFGSVKRVGIALSKPGAQLRACGRLGGARGTVAAWRSPQGWRGVPQDSPRAGGGS